MQTKNDSDLYGGQRSSEVKCGKLYAMATILGQKNCWCKLRMMMTMEVKDHHWSNLYAMATIFGQKNHWCNLRMMMTLMEVKGQQRSNVVNYSPWLPNLVRRTADASLRWWWPSWRSEVKYSKQWSVATTCGQKNCWCKFRMIMTFTEVRDHNNKQCSGATKLGQKSGWCKFRMMVTFMAPGQRSTEIKYSKQCICPTFMIFGE